MADLDPAVVKKERDRLTEEARKTGKPENIIEKMVDGRIKVFYRDEAGVLVEQPFAKDETKSVSQVLAEKGLKAKAFTLWVLVRVAFPDFAHESSPGTKWLIAGVVLGVAIIAFILGLNQEHFLTCWDFQLSGNHLPATCTPAPTPGS